MTSQKLLAVSAACLLSLGAASINAWAAELGDPVGNLLAQDGRGVVRMEPCAEGLCGIIVGIARAPGDPMPTAFTGRPQCGMVIFTGTDARAEGGTAEGRITDPRDGRTYRAQLWREPANRLHLRGYIGVPLLGVTQVWLHSSATSPRNAGSCEAEGIGLARIVRASRHF